MTYSVKYTHINKNMIVYYGGDALKLKKITVIFCSLFFALSTGEAKKCSALDKPEVSAKAAVLIEAATGEIIYEKTAHTKLPMASTTKIMTTLLCLESGNLDEEFVVDSEAIRTEGSSMGLQEGDIVSKRDLCIGMLLPSGNDAANATAVHIGGSVEGFAELMNKRAEQIGMTRTCFVTPSGLDAQGHGSSAYDMALLAREALKNKDFAQICSQETIKLSFGNPPYDRWLKNTNKLLSMYDGVTGVKTGFTDEAGRCLVSSCTQNNVSLICVTLNAPSDWEDHRKLYDYGFSQLKAEKIIPESFVVKVVGGIADEIGLVSYTDTFIGVKDGDFPELTAEAYIENFLYAPVEEGTYAGYVEYFYKDRLVARNDLYTSGYTEIYKGKKEKEESTISKIIDFLKNIF